MAIDSTEYNAPILDHHEAERWDKFSIEQAAENGGEKPGVESRLLMGWAGYSAFLDLIRSKQFHSAETIHLLAGAGNNGGDGYVICWHILSAFNKKCTVWILKEPQSEDSKYYYELCRSLKNNRQKEQYIEFKNLDEHAELLNGAINKNDIVIDALFGTGLNKPPHEFLQKVFSALNGNENILRISIDIASGVYAGGDVFTHQAFKAHITYTFGSYKIGHLLEPGKLYSGQVKVLPIGFYPKEQPYRRLAQKKEMPPLRKPGSHKYSSGVVTVAGGSDGMEGAAILAARSFLALGGGLAKIVSVSPHMKTILAKHPEFMVMSEKTPQEMEKSALKIVLEKPVEQAMVIGVGLKEKLSREFWTNALSIENLHLLVDGSALGQLYEIKEIFKQTKVKTLTFTPHKNEAQQLLNRKITNMRLAALEISEMYNSNVYLKGPGGILVLNENKDGTLNKPTEIYFNSDHYELAVGGTGDVLSGVLANSLMRMGLEGIEAGLYYYLQASEEYVNQTGKRNKGKDETGFSKDFLEPSGLIEQLQSTWGNR